ncbi:hypothetical protein Tco_0699029 [Tanacetum coccineum]
MTAAPPPSTPTAAYTYTTTTTTAASPHHRVHLIIIFITKGALVCTATTMGAWGFIKHQNGVLRKDTCEGYTVILPRGVLEGTPRRGTHSLSPECVPYGGWDTCEGYIFITA